MEDEIIDVTKLNSIHIDSYMDKESFIKMLDNLKFTHVKTFDINLITGFEYDAKENKTNPKGFNIEYR